MAYPKRELEIVPECNDEVTGEPTCWAMLVGKSYREGDEVGKPSKNHYLWITKYGEKEYWVEDSRGYNRAGDKIYTTLQGAKRKAEEIAWRQDFSGCYSD